MKQRKLRLNYDGNLLRKANALVIIIAEACGSLGPSHTAAVLFRRLFIIGIAFHIPD
jgi:hypothetical protein